jgi:hypothetical protein
MIDWFFIFLKPKIYFLSVKDTVILYNIALILQKLASQLLRDEKSTLEEVLQVCNHKHLFKKNRGPNFDHLLNFEPVSSKIL